MTALPRKKWGKDEASVDEETGKWAFQLYCLFIVSYFLHAGDRISLLGAIRIDILLSGLTFLLIVTKKRLPGAKAALQPTSKWLLILIIYIVVSLPFVQWPGSVIGRGWDPFLKAIYFYFLTVSTVTSQRRLKVFLGVFVGVQVFRVLEPLYMHFTTGYWGSFTHMGNYEFMDRLSGSPFDIINPNGLAFVILVSLTFLHNLLFHGDRNQKLLYLLLAGPLLYAMLLTGSRSGFSVLVLYALMIIWRSKHRAVALSIAAVVVTVLFASISDLERQRYLSIVDKNAKGAATAEGRVDGLWIDFKVGLERPLFGHGLGTSAEANAHAYGDPKPSHTLYTEVLQELGFVGLFIYLGFIVVTCKNCLQAVRLAALMPPDFLQRAAGGLRDLAVLLVVFSIASYGLNEYQWYMLSGLSVVLCRILNQQYSANASPPAAVEAARLHKNTTKLRMHGMKMSTR